MKKSLAFLLAACLCLTSLVGCGKESSNAASEELTAAKDYLYSMYKDKQGATPSDFERVASIAMSGATYDVEWTSNAGDNVVITVADKIATIDVNEATTEEITYVLTATIKDAEGKTISVDFNHSIPAYKDTTWAEYAAAADDTIVNVTGVVTGIMSKTNGNSSNCLYLQDADGGYYVYNMAQDPVADLNLTAGMTVKATGAKSLYSGTYEIMNANVTVLDTNVTAVEPLDITDIYTAAADLKDAKLVEKQAFLVTVKGVEITGQDVSGGYYKFKLADKESYERISSSVCPIVADKDEFIQGHTDHLGWTANVTGVICVYDGAFYLSPVTKDAIEYVSLPERSDEDMVAFEADNITLPTSFQSETSIDLAAEGKGYKDVKIAWTTSNDVNAAIADGKLNIVLPEEENAEVTVTATLTAGSASTTKEFAFVVEAPSSDLCEAEVLEKAFALEEGAALNGAQVLRGKVTEIVSEYSAEYGNITVNIEVLGQTVQCFRLKGEGADTLAVGDEITVTGNLKNYKGTVEFDANCTFSKDLSVEEAKQLVILDKAFALEEGKAMTGYQVLRGTITEIPSAYSAEYGNITVNIQVGDKVVQCFRLMGEGADALAVGDDITVTGNLKNYKGTVEFDAKCTFVKGQSLEDAKQALALTQAFALEEGAAMKNKSVLTGTITEIVSEYSAEYGNITVNMQCGDQVVQCFRLKGEGADALAVGDTITVTGLLKNYKGTVEFDAGCTFTK